MDSKLSKILQDIKNLKIQGAREIAKAGVKSISLFTARSKTKTKSQFLSGLENLGRTLSQVRPTEPALRNVVKNILLETKQFEGGLEDTKKLVLKLCENYLGMMEEALNKIAEIGSHQIENGDMILTHCHSHSVVEIFRKAKSQGKTFEVIVTETRPKYQGIITAKKLLNSKIKVTFCVDSAVGWVMKKTDKVLVGCDAILADGSVVNKIGTLPIAVLAERFGVPFLVAGGTYKFDPETVAGIPEPIEERDPKEVINPRKLPGAKIINPVFDVIPSEYIRAIITEKGIMRPELVREFVK